MGYNFRNEIRIEKGVMNARAPLFLLQKNGVGAVVCAAAQNYIPVIELTPQQVKRASGLGTKIDKNTVKAIASRLFGSTITSHHEADAALCALAGCLEARKAMC